VTGCTRTHTTARSKFNQNGAALSDPGDAQGSKRAHPDDLRRKRLELCVIPVPRGRRGSRRRSDSVVAVEHIQGMRSSSTFRGREFDEGLAQMFDWLRFADATFSTQRDSRSPREPRSWPSRAAHPTARGSRRASAAERTELFRHARRRRDAIDPSGLVKGWAVTRSIDSRRGRRRNYAVNVAGDMRCAGRAVRNPAGASASSIRWSERDRRGRRGNDLALRRRARTRAEST